MYVISSNSRAGLAIAFLTFQAFQLSRLSSFPAFQLSGFLAFQLSWENVDLDQEMPLVSREGGGARKNLENLENN